MRRKVIRCVIAIIIMAVCIIVGTILKNHGIELRKKWFDVRLFYYYAVVIGPVLCLLIGVAMGLLIKTFALIKAPRMVFRIVVAVTVLYALIFVLMFLDLLTTSNFIYGTVGPNGAKFLLEGGRYLFIIMGLVDVLLWQRREGEMTEPETVAK